MKGFLTHFTRSVMIPGAAVAVVVGVIFASERRRPGINTWLALTDAVIVSVNLAGPLLAGFAAWEASRSVRRGLRRLWTVSPQPQRAPLVILVTNVLWATVAYIAVLVTTHVAALNSKPWGQPEWLWLVNGWLGLAVLVAVGSLAGFVAPYRLTPPIVAVATYVLLVVLVVILPTYLGPRVAFLSPSVQQLPNVFAPPDNLFLSGQTVWYLGILGILLALLHLEFDARQRGTRIATASALVASVGAALLLMGPNGFYGYRPYDQLFTYACSDSVPIVCVHPAFEDELPTLTADLQALNQRVGADGPLAHPTYIQILRGDPTADDPRIANIYFDDLRLSWREQMIGELAYDLITAGGGACRDVERVSPDGPWMGYSSIVASWISDGAASAVLDSLPEQRAVALFETWPDSKKQEWVATNLTAICAGTLTETDFE